MVLVPLTTILPSIDNTCFSPAAKLPTDHVNSLPSIVAKPVLSKVISLGTGLLTSTFSSTTEDIFSTSISKAIGPPSSPCATDNDLSWERAGFVSSRSLRAIIRIPSTLYFML